MRKISFWFILLSMFALQPVYAGCMGKDSSYQYTWWNAPITSVSVDYTQKNITSENLPNKRIGTLTIEFRCPMKGGPYNYYFMPDNSSGFNSPVPVGNDGIISVPLTDFNVASASRLQHKDGWVHIMPDGPVMSAFSVGDISSKGQNHIKFDGFINVMGGANLENPRGRHKYGIYLSKAPTNVMSTSQIITFLTSASSQKIIYNVGGNKNKVVDIIPTINGENTATLNFQNTVTCSVSNNIGRDIDLGMVNTSGDFKTPLTTVVLKMSCGLSNGGPQDITSNFPSVIVPGSASITIDSPTAQSMADPLGNQVLHFGKGWGLKFETLGTNKLDINTLDNISIPIFAYKVSPSASAADSWSGAINFTINYN
ncbi:hypothetical protein SNO08_001969 [Salmonella enterica]|nr:hypothetical protein [Salmonella enterica]